MRRDEVGTPARFVKVPVELLGTLPPVEFAVYCALLNRINNLRQCWPSHESIARDSLCSKRSAISALVSLRDRGLVQWQHQALDHGRGRTSNMYTLRDLNAESALRSDGGVPSGATKVQNLRDQSAKSALNLVQNLHREIDPIELDPMNYPLAGARGVQGGTTEKFIQCDLNAESALRSDGGVPSGATKEPAPLSDCQLWIRDELRKRDASVSIAALSAGSGYTTKQIRQAAQSWPASVIPRIEYNTRLDLIRIEKKPLPEC